MKCNAIQKDIVSLNTLPKAVKDHLDSCADCRRYLSEFQSLKTELSEIEIKTPSVLSNSTLANALSVLETGKRLTLAERLKNYWHSPKFALGLTFSFLLVFFAMLTILLIVKGDDQSRRFITLILVTIFFQNLIMAFSLPLFLNQSGNNYNF